MTNLTTSAGWPIGGVWAMEPTAFYDALSALDRMDFAAHLADWRREQGEREQGEKERAEGKTSGGEGGSSEQPLYATEDGVAILALEGPMTKKPTSMSRYFGGASTLEVQHALRKAGQDPAVKAVLLVIDSPGGHIDGTAELADEVARVNKLKPVDVYADGTCCSAAMWVASQARTITAPRTAHVGSIGTIFSVTDSSAAAKAAGITRHVFATDELKGGGTPGTAVTDAHKAHFQSIVQSSQVPFTAAIAQGRNLTTEQVKALGSRIFVGKKAQQAGLVDHIGNYDSALARLKRHDPATYNPKPDKTDAPKGTSYTSKEKPMKHLLAGALAALGMHTLAGKISAAPSDAEGNADPQALANLLASETKAEVDAQVKTQLAAHPLLGPLTAAGITTPEQLAALQLNAKAGEQGVQAQRDAAKKNAIIAYGQEAGALEAQTIDVLPAGAALDRYAARLKADADKAAPPSGSQPKTAGTQTQVVPTFAQDAGTANAAQQQDEAVKRRLGATSLGRAALAAKKN